MNRKVRFLASAIGFAIAAVAPITSGATASAAPVDTPLSYDVVLLQGTANANVDYLSNSGSYTIRAGTTCTGIASDPSIDLGVPTVDPELLGSCTASIGGGTFNNTACGTGTATGGASSVTESSGESATDSTSLPGYSLQFVAGNALLLASGTESATGEASSAVTVVGVANLAPPSGEPFLPDTTKPGDGPCVDAFDFTAILVSTS